MRAIHVVAMVLFMMPIGVGYGQWYDDGKLAPDTSWSKVWGDHGVMLHLTDKPNELFEAWEKPGAAVPVSTARVANRGGKPIVGVVFFTGCEITPGGMCDVVGVFQVFKPDGSPYGEEETGELWVGKPPPKDGDLQLGVGAIGVRIEPQDPAGTYTVRARLRDNVSQGEIELTRTFRVESEATE